MNINTFKKKWNYKSVVDYGGQMSKEAKTLARNFVDLVRDSLYSEGYELQNWSIGHYYVGGFILKGNICFYISWNIPRYGKIIVLEHNDFHNGVLIRTAKDQHDYSGGANNSTSVLELKEKVKEMEMQQKSA